MDIENEIDFLKYYKLIKNSYLYIVVKFVVSFFIKCMCFLIRFLI